MSKKNKKTEKPEQLQGKIIEPNPELTYPEGRKEHMIVTMPVHTDKYSKEEVDIEDIWRMINIKYNTPDVQYISKTIVYDCQFKKITSAEYQIGVIR